MNQTEHLGGFTKFYPGQVKQQIGYRPNPRTHYI